MNIDVEDTLKIPLHFDSHAKQPKDKAIPYEIPGRPWKSIADIFSTSNKHHLYIVDHHTKFTVIMQMDGFNVDNLLQT